jgi:thioredoxin-like negative regulator of GroEL
MKPVVDRLSREYAGKVDFVVYGDVNADQAVSRFSSTQGVRVVPTMVLVDSQGREAKRILGSVPEAELRQALDAAK